MFLTWLQGEMWPQMKQILWSDGKSLLSIRSTSQEMIFKALKSCFWLKNVKAITHPYKISPKTHRSILQGSTMSQNLDLSPTNAP